MKHWIELSRAFLLIKSDEGPGLQQSLAALFKKGLWGMCKDLAFTPRARPCILTRDRNQGDRRLARGVARPYVQGTTSARPLTPSHP